MIDRYLLDDPLVDAGALAARLAATVLRDPAGQGPLPVVFSDDGLARPALARVVESGRLVAGGQPGR